MDDFNARLKQVEAQLIAEFPHFEKAAKTMMQNLLANHAGLKHPDRPLGIYLLLGTTGKNPLPYKLAQYLYGVPLVYVVMDDYAERDAYFRLRHEMMRLADKHKVFLFDTVEYSHPNVRELLTELMHDAHLTDEQGQRCALTDCIFFMTTDAAASLLINREVLKDPVQHQHVMDTIYQILGVRFYTPFDEVLPFFQGGTYA